MASPAAVVPGRSARFRVSPRIVWERSLDRMRLAGGFALVAWIFVAFGSTDGTAILVLLVTTASVVVGLLALFLVEVARGGVEVSDAIVERRRFRTTTIEWDDLAGVTLVPDESWLRIGEGPGHRWRTGVLATHDGRRHRLPVQGDMGRRTRGRLAEVLSAGAAARGITVRRDADG